LAKSLGLDKVFFAPRGQRQSPAWGRQGDRASLADAAACAGDQDDAERAARAGLLLKGRVVIHGFSCFFARNHAPMNKSYPHVLTRGELFDKKNKSLISFFVHEMWGMFPLSTHARFKFSGVTALGLFMKKYEEGLWLGVGRFKRSGRVRMGCHFFGWSSKRGN
jgi:hypothetical protein